MRIDQKDGFVFRSLLVAKKKKKNYRTPLRTTKIIETT